MLVSKLFTELQPDVLPIPSGLVLKVVNIEPSKSSLAIKLPVTPISGTSANLEPFDSF